MCTIIGWRGRVSTQIVRHLIGMSYEYGPHATGVAYADAGGRPRVFKKSKHPHVFLREHDRTVRCAAKSELGIAHTRFASVGRLTEANAHPFVHKGLVYCHNGTIRNWRDLDDTVSSDSQVLGPLLLSHETWKAVGQAGIAWMYGGDLFVYRRDKPLTVVTFFRENPVTIAATYAFMIPKWLWESEYVVHKLQEFVAYKVVEGGVERVWEEP